jgi:hypothetical protein
VKKVARRAKACTPPELGSHRGLHNLCKYHLSRTSALSGSTQQQDFSKERTITKQQISQRLLWIFLFFLKKDGHEHPAYECTGMKNQRRIHFHPPPRRGCIPLTVAKGKENKDGGEKGKRLGGKPSYG